ncbi:phage tail protein [Sphingomonas pokkalii]|uniref:Phage tail protein n=1 Tax=Sphingomonas pokkalii TaxID=2175090 RepID=A0A2U0S948_9SPHN|nr:tail fiber protein [Sphingomonas pokkalii]PVX27896.1 phage tail protein [Sphingomonas pokkalii]
MSDPYLGEITIFVGNYAPINWALCNGQMLKISEYEALFSVIGTTYGGDGVKTFGLPDLRGRLPIGTGKGVSLNTNYTLGQAVGTNTVTLTPAQMPSHTHVMSVSSQAATSDTPGPNLTFADVGAAALFYVNTGYATASGTTDFSAASVSDQGGGGSHENRMPTTGINFIICTSGLYPNFQ